MNDSSTLLEVYRLVIDKCYRMNLLKEQIDPQNLSENLNDEELSNALVQALMPRIQRTLDKGLFEMYQVLYTIDVDEEEIKARIMDLENTSMIPSIIGFAIVDRLKGRYARYPAMLQGRAHHPALPHHS